MQIHAHLMMVAALSVGAGPAMAGMDHAPVTPQGTRDELPRETVEKSMTSPAVLAPPDPTLCPGATHVAYRFSGVSDDGEKGSTTRKKATSIHCTNIDPLLDVTVKVQLFQYNGTDVFEGCITMQPNTTTTFSTQNTTIYFDDIILGGIPGTDAIFQGSGRILIDQGDVTCTAQVLDPLNYPPVFISRLPAWGACGFTRDLSLVTSSVVGSAEFTACRRISAGSAFGVAAGGAAVLRSGRRVALTNGFHVEPGGALTVVVDPALGIE